MPEAERTQPEPERAQVDVVIFGGGVAGLWTLDALIRRGLNAVLFERDALGVGQTGWSQGILHSGVKYALSGVMNESAAAVSALPDRWKACLEARGEIDLSATQIRSKHCWLWRTESLRSKVGMLGAKLALKTKPQAVRDDERPPILRACPGEIARLGEWVIDPRSLVQTLATPHAARVLRGELVSVEHADASGASIIVRSGAHTLHIAARAIVLAAGGGNATLRTAFGLSAEAQQIRPLRMLVVKGQLPELNGHCVDGAATRVTVTSVPGTDGSTVWQVGGQVAERGPGMPIDEHRAWALNELHAALPGLDLHGCVAGSYDAPRAEAASAGKRPDDAVVKRRGSILTVWPTKLVLAPRAADMVCEALADLAPNTDNTPESLLPDALHPLASANAADFIWEQPAFAWHAIADA